MTFGPTAFLMLSSNFVLFRVMALACSACGPAGACALIQGQQIASRSRLAANFLNLISDLLCGDCCQRGLHAVEALAFYLLRRTGGRKTITVMKLFLGLVNLRQ